MFRLESTLEKLWYRECRTGRRFIIKIQPGARVMEALLAFARAENIRFMSIVSAVGSVHAVEFHGIQGGPQLPITGPRITTHKLDEPLELMGLEGNICRNAAKELDAQMYIIAARASGEVVGGHLVDAEVLATCEIVMAEYLVEGIERYHSVTGGVDTLFIDEESAPI
jgi:predicted DNA-binding protein with PD1-like motif